MNRGRYNVVITYLFILSLVLVVVAFYAGASTDATAFGKVFNGILNTATGRNSSGQFASYPGGFTPLG
jgi:hypothetical protein